MKLRRGKLLVDPPAASSSDIAFILIIFFLVCASVQPETGLAQTLPRTEAKEEKREQSKNLEISITPSNIVLNGSPLKLAEFSERIAVALQAKSRPEDKVVVVKSSADTPYDHWIRVSQAIDNAGGIITLEITSEQTITVE
ncbi:MAG: biopolymer transporter ExbD [Roseibacillus sp.]